MSDVDEFSHLIGDIYDASLDPGLWSEALDNICAFAGAKLSAVGAQDAVGRTVSIHLLSTHHPEFRRSYEKTYFKLNPIFPMVLFAPVEQTLGVTDVLPREEFEQTRFAREWLAPQGLIDGLFTTLDKSAISCAVFTLMRHGRQGLFDDEARRRFELVVPHVRRAVLIGKTIDLKTVEAAVLADSLDTLSSGMFLVDANGRIVHANASGHLMAAEGNVVRVTRARLDAVDPRADRALTDSFDACAAGDAALGRKGIAVPIKARDGARYVANVLPLTAGARRAAGSSYSAVASVFVHNATLDLPSPLEAIKSEFQLTPAELRVLFAIIEVGGVPDVAQVLGLSEATVKTHLHHLFEKTGTTRQAELVKLVAGYANALVG